MSFFSIFNQILILFIIMLTGYYLRKKEFIDKDFTTTVAKLILSFFLPSMIINSMQIEYNPNMISKIFTLLLISLLMYIISFIIAYMLKFIFKSKDNIGIYQYIVMFSNVGFMGYPVVEAILGKDAIFYTAIFNLPFNLLIITIGVYFLSNKNEINRFSFKSFINPIIVSLVVGLMLFIFRIKLPQSINQSLRLLGDLTTPLSMIVIGSMLFDSSAKNCFTNKKLFFISFIRLVLLPLVIYLILKDIVEDQLLLAIPIIISAMPAAANTAIMAVEYKSNEVLASQSVFLTTLLSLVTIPLISIFLI